MTDEALFTRRFLDDVRLCASGRSSAVVAEIDRRVRVALIAPPSLRERRWARVVAAVRELLDDARDADRQAADRLRAFVRENEDLGRPRDVALTDFRIVQRAESLLTDGAGRTYLVFTPAVRALARPIAPLDEIVPSPTRRLAEWAVYALVFGGWIVALWYAFVQPR